MQIGQLIQIQKKPDDELSIIEAQLKELHSNFQKFANMWWHLKIIPPTSKNPEDAWLSPWEVESEQALTEEQRSLLFNFLEYLNKIFSLNHLMCWVVYRQLKYYPHLQTH